MRRSRTLRAGALALLVAASAATGCISHNHYYTASGVPTYTTTDIGPVQIGTVCETAPPQLVGGTVIAQAAPAAAAPVTAAPRVVVSQPGTGSRLSWRRADPEGGLATTHVDGAVEDPVQR